MKAVGSLLIAAVLMASGGAAQARSCMWLADHYVVSCEQGRCTPLFRAVQVPKYGHCGRVTRVEPFPVWAEEPILALAADGARSSFTPVVISVECLHHFPEVARARGELGHLMIPPQIVEHTEPPAVVRAWYENRGAAETRRIRNREVIDVTIYVVTILILTGGTLWLMQALGHVDRRRQSRVLRVSLAIKAIAIALEMGALFLVPGLVWKLPPLQPIFVPAALVLMLVDEVAYLLCRSPMPQPLSRRAVR